jgi:glycosyltransferase involved in cell wall biosynthesis
MNVAHFTPEYPPSTTGGLGTYMQGLIEYQRQMGDRVDIFYVWRGDAPAGTLSLPFDEEGLLRTYTLSDIQTAGGAGRYDVVVCQDWPGILASQPSWRKHAPVVTTCHLPLAWDIGYYDDLPCQYAKDLEFFAMAQSDRIIAVSNSVKRHLESEYSFVQGKTSVVYNGTDTSFFSPLDSKKARADASSPVVLYVGRFFEQKGADLLPVIFAALKQRRADVRFKVIGVGPLKDDLLRDFHSHGLLDSLDFFDFSPLKFVLELYREADVVIMPSRYEPFGLVATECMATGTPLVASNVGGLSEIITHGHDGFLVNSEDVDEFVHTILSLLEDEALARRISQAARDTAVTKFNQEKCFENTRNLYLKVAEEWY